MASAKEPIVPYAGSCNPPRRAKRARVDAPDNAAKDTIRRGRPPILPKEPIPDHEFGDANDSDSTEGDDYDPSPKTAAPRRRGRKPGTMSRSARESLRKLNHSRIEKARRTKINEALATLSGLVNDAERRRAEESGDARAYVLEDVQPSGKVKSEEKEFKLDVLVKTVIYTQELMEKVKLLEAGGCPNCARDTLPSPPSPTTPKRKRSADDTEYPPGTTDSRTQRTKEVEEDIYAEDDEKGDAEDHEQSPAAPPSPIHTPPNKPSPSPCLPPIASWLPHPYVDPSTIAALATIHPGTYTQPSYLPSPPLSGGLRPANHAPYVPALVLPGPARTVSPSLASPSPRPPASGPHVRAEPRVHVAIPTGASTSGGAGATFPSPARTPEDETAASLLLEMSTSPGLVAASGSGSVSSLTLPRAVDAPVCYDGRRESRATSTAGQIHTPSSLLGIARAR
ncbi:hypothetical protein WOLCODRAFT_140885 [Wolfiporia cocos MD-104 SS10]|uniref:BHLH domain-containing protein n=1 Tax=Wolfiporia cocos (strain MD-104) TaxID=742152 RepID=A0A2H3JIC0_WOLCO|nr:hypothetical protein WOLCODRAFT_140885 [Wolfiporia cocos MD-104 SS10]